MKGLLGGKVGGNVGVLEVEAEPVDRVGDQLIAALAAARPQGKVSVVPPEPEVNQDLDCVRVPRKRFRDGRDQEMEGKGEEGQGEEGRRKYQEGCPYFAPRALVVLTTRSASATDRPSSKASPSVAAMVEADETTDTRSSCT